MQVIDEITGNKVGYGSCRRIVTGFAENGDIIYGYTRHWREKCIRARITGKDGRREDAFILNNEELRKDIFFSNLSCTYMLRTNMPKKDYVREAFTMGQGKFPYSFDRKYEAIESFNIFENRQKILNPKQYPLGEFLRYSFGLEFETSMGYIPEDICIRDGLIPLRDGSISGLEYSTVVLEGNGGISLLEQQLSTLKKYTTFNKECSLHIHLGGFPLEKSAIFRLYSICKGLEGEIMQYVPELTFNTAQYKASGKDYCKLLPSFSSFDDLYHGLVGRRFFGDLTQPHPADPDRHHKWNIHTRYFWLNLMNMVCYDVNKTVEFRLLRPTYNFSKITLWLYIMNAILRYAEMGSEPEPTVVSSGDPIFDALNRIRVPTGRRLMDIIKAVYPEDIAEELSVGLMKLKVLNDNQRRGGDRIGAFTELEDRLFDNC